MTIFADAKKQHIHLFGQCLVIAPGSGVAIRIGTIHWRYRAPGRHTSLKDGSHGHPVVALRMICRDTPFITEVETHAFQQRKPREFRPRPIESLGTAATSEHHAALASTLENRIYPAMDQRSGQLRPSYIVKLPDVHAQFRMLNLSFAMAELRPDQAVDRRQQSTSAQPGKRRHQPY